MKTLPAKKLLLAIIALLTTALGWAQQGVLVGDTVINSGAPTTNYGSSMALTIGGTDSTLLIFDPIGVLPAGTTAAQVLKARLIVFPHTVTTAGQIGAYQVTSMWQEPTVTYATRPSMSSTPTGTATITAVNNYLEIDLTSLVKNWVSSRIPILVLH